MIATISPANCQCHHTINTLKYADQEKEIKTHIQKNIGMIDTLVSNYQRMIDSLHIEVCHLRKELAEKESQLSVKPAEKTVDDELSWLDILSRDTSENVQERINLQKALFELDETNLRNRSKLQHLDDAIAKQVRCCQHRSISWLYLGQWTRISNSIYLARVICAWI
ncbi:kinesin-like protein KIN-8B isoform X2 [Hevea brasiliensis]|uniref:kinesin-like protein KIN-8B isoform X2 n=1 Tax=Hevea brasiliensis TaxID=3981 RepID=UPI0025CE2A6D|nr:kinesin-like protein KIN-8B isoform X2 [Hevea brasiliensis]XP_058006234.1 kinesin-like protein KIN-8B isoform X2 [Hevea brasiliensis]XP_058006235.1 kinesin-like protein KIN-8B isoform X2 [Hevea brasiliensis]XP_058006236.1 kinesin-like protein KIN-8B isoform X2 [Hevea brasiliensis]